MVYKIITIIILAVFYLFYVIKLVSLNKQNIKTNQVGLGNKNLKVKIAERLMSLSNVIVIIAQVLSIVFISPSSNIVFRITSIILGLLAIMFFASATITMKNNWRVGIPEEKTELVANGIYKISRNPAFVGFDLLYISTCIMYFNIWLLVSLVFASGMLHVQILQEEKHMEDTFGKEYEEYKSNTCRYIGRKNLKSKK